MLISAPESGIEGNTWRYRNSHQALSSASARSLCAVAHGVLRRSQYCNDRPSGCNDQALMLIGATER